jgi:preprotein translocase subunit SecE
MKAFTKITGFLGEFKTELGKVSWSTRQELIGSTVVVISLTALIAVFIFVVDSFLAKILSIIFKA